MAKAISLRELQLTIKKSLVEAFPLPVWVSAEISEFKLNYSGHCYLELVEKGEADGLSKAQARGVIWRNSYTSIAALFHAQTGQQLGVGLKVLVKVVVNFHEIYGLSLQITDIDPSYTLGDMERQRQLTIAQLQKDGVWDLNREQPMAQLVQRVAVVSSANAAGYQDFVRELERSPYYTNTQLFDAYMQGATAEESIVAALESIAERCEEFDAVVIIRGGGSVSDLWCFNSYRLASHVAQFPLPIIAGIGHDKDVSVVDMVAHTSLKTPTAVAGWLIERMESIDGWLDAAVAQLLSASASITRTYHLSLLRLEGELLAATKQLVEHHKIYLENNLAQIKELALHSLERESLRLQSAERIVEQHSPQHLLKLGYAVVRASSAQAINSIAELEPGATLTIELLDGSVKTQVTEITKKS